MKDLLVGSWWLLFLWLALSDLDRMRLPYAALGLWTVTGILIRLQGTGDPFGLRLVLSLFSFLAVTGPCLLACRAGQMGGGDVYMLGVLSLMMSLERLIVCISVSFLLAFMTSLLVVWIRKKGRIPLAPFLGIGVWIAGGIG